jgi:hypothetical protein
LCKACPCGATIQRKDGIVTIDYDKCVGAGIVLLLSLPAAYIYGDEKEYFPGQGLTELEAIVEGYILCNQEQW